MKGLMELKQRNQQWWFEDEQDGWGMRKRRQIPSVYLSSVICRYDLFEQKYFVKGSDSNMHWSLHITGLSVRRIRC